MEDPFLPISEMPESERPHVFHLSGRLSALTMHVMDFEHALSLLFFLAEHDSQADLRLEEARKLKRSVLREFEHNRERVRQLEHARTEFLRAIEEVSRISRWMCIPVRDAILTIYHFRSALYSIDDALAKCPTLANRVRISEIKDAKELFETEFPDAVGTRHVVAHSADTLYSVEEIRKHSTDEFYMGGNFVFSTDVIGNRTVRFSGTRREKGNQEARVVTADLNQATLDKLTRTAEQVLNAFRDVDQRKRFGYNESGPPG